MSFFFTSFVLRRNLPIARTIFQVVNCNKFIPTTAEGKYMQVPLILLVNRVLSGRCAWNLNKYRGLVIALKGMQRYFISQLTNKLLEKNLFKFPFRLKFFRVSLVVLSIKNLHFSLSQKKFLYTTTI